MDLSWLDYVPHELAAWAESQEGGQASWDLCPRGDWMLWCLGYRKHTKVFKLYDAVMECALIAREEAVKRGFAPGGYELFTAMNVDGGLVQLMLSEFEARVPEADTMIKPAKLPEWHANQAIRHAALVYLGDPRKAFAAAWHAAQLIGHDKVASVVRAKFPDEAFSPP